MPGQLDFELAAASLRAGRDTLGDARRAVADSQARPTIEGGTIAPLVTTSLGVAVANVDDAIRQLDELAALCLRRAAICADHARALVQWQRRDDAWNPTMLQHRADPTTPHPGSRPARPDAPYVWVEPR